MGFHVPYQRKREQKKSLRISHRMSECLMKKCSNYYEIYGAVEFSWCFLRAVREIIANRSLCNFYITYNIKWKKKQKQKLDHSQEMCGKHSQVYSYTSTFYVY